MTTAALVCRQVSTPETDEALGRRLSTQRAHANSRIHSKYVQILWSHIPGIAIVADCPSSIPEGLDLCCV